ncbi:MAG TPA: hydroxymethylbilane synthase [Terriglobia bacterium]|nr:hydroxymethylbilane synthase [Terriglobia bacterium]
MRIVIGSRGSALALWQANWVRDRLASAGHEVDVRVIRTSGDRLVRVPLESSGVKGLFVKEIEEALAAGTIDVAVHSFKDLPTEQPPGLGVAAVPAREDPHDAYISGDGRSFNDLPPGSRVGTSSLRRQSQLRYLRDDIEVVPIRGNVDTRLRKLERGECDALVVAAAGLMRLGLLSRITHCFPPAKLCPAVGQGALAIETRESDRPLADAVRVLDDPVAHTTVRAERAALRGLGGGCAVPIAAHASLSDGRLDIIGVVARPDGSRLIRARALGPGSDPDAVGLALAQDLLLQGARDILEAA